MLRFVIEALATHFPMAQVTVAQLPKAFPDLPAGWQVDAALSCRLPKRYGIISPVSKNLFNEEFNYIDSDPTNQKFLPEQPVFLTLTLQF